MNLRLGHGLRAFQEIVVAALVGLGDVVGVELDVAALLGPLLRHVGGEAVLQLLVRDLQADVRAATSMEIMSPLRTAASGPPI